MATMKAKKGNPFEYDVMYSLSKKDGMKVFRPDTNIKGIDIIAFNTISNKTYLIECKNRSMNWNSLVSIYLDNIERVKKFVEDNDIINYEYLIVFKPKRTEPLVFSDYGNRLFCISQFHLTFYTNFEKRPKRFNLNSLLINKYKPKKED